MKLNLSPNLNERCLWHMNSNISIDSIIPFFPAVWVKAMRWTQCKFKKSNQHTPWRPLLAKRVASICARMSSSRMKISTGIWRSDASESDSDSSSELETSKWRGGSADDCELLLARRARFRGAPARRDSLSESVAVAAMVRLDMVSGLKERLLAC